MLTENEVIIAMRNWLKNKGYSIISYTQDTQQGHDIVASKNGREFFVEAKGGRSGATKNDFDINYQWRCVADAFFKQVREKEWHPEAEIGIALPDGGRYRELMKGLQDFCGRQGLRVFWVSAPDQVEEWPGAQPSVPANIHASATNSV